jgi:2-polyprenyl-3-methyl-5-hydroxy-6-metoxy-1,4-benzoquinol methylase
MIMDSDDLNYPLGYSAHESRRLVTQAALLADLTKEALNKAGVGEGMRVLDLGSGPGDVSLLAASLVGTSGSVVGIDRWGPSISTARLRAGAAGLHNVHFIQGELDDFNIDREFDAIIGRFILLYLRDPASLLRRLSRQLRQGGVILFQEVDMSTVSQHPPSPLFAEVYRWIFAAFSAAGAERDMGAKLLPTFLSANLPRPEMIAVTPVQSGPNSAYYEFLSDMVVSMLPIIERAGIASAAEIDVATLADRLRQDVVDNKRVIFAQRVVSAWTNMA